MSETLNYLELSMAARLSEEWSIVDLSRLGDRVLRDYTMVVGLQVPEDFAKVEQAIYGKALDEQEYVVTYDDQAARFGGPVSQWMRQNSRLAGMIMGGVAILPHSADVAIAQDPFIRTYVKGKNFEPTDSDCTVLYLASRRAGLKTRVVDQTAALATYTHRPKGSKTGPRNRVRRTIGPVNLPTASVDERSNQPTTEMLRLLRMAVAYSVSLESSSNVA